MLHTTFFAFCKAEIATISPLRFRPPPSLSPTQKNRQSPAGSFSLALAHAAARRSVLLILFNNLRYNARAYRMAAFADSKTKTFVHRNRVNQCCGHRNVIARHYHLGAFLQFN